MLSVIVLCCTRDSRESSIASCNALKRSYHTVLPCHAVLCCAQHNGRRARSTDIVSDEHVFRESWSHRSYISVYGLM